MTTRNGRLNGSNIWLAESPKTVFNNRLPEWDRTTNIFEFCIQTALEIRARETKDDTPVQRGRRL